MLNDVDIDQRVCRIAMPASHHVISRADHLATIKHIVDNLPGHPIRLASSNINILNFKNFKNIPFDV